MKLTTVIFKRDSLASNITRNLLGERVINLAEDLSKKEGNSNIFSRVFSFGKKLLGFAVSSLLTFGGWSLTAIWDFAIEAYYEIIYFDWNQTDAEIRNQLRSNDTIISGALGRLTGTGLVWLTGIAVSAGLSFKFPVLAGRVALKLAEEGGYELRAALTNFILTARNVAVQNFLLIGLLDIRSLKRLNQQPVTTERKPWTIADKVEEKVNSITNAKLKAFVNGLLDSVEDSIIEMGYVIAYTLDDYYESQRIAQQELLGQERSIVITPDTRVEGEQFVLESPQELVIADTQQLINQHQLIYNRDVGQITGSYEEDYIHPSPQRRKLRVVFKSANKPPWKNPDGSRAKEIKLVIPNVKYSLTWEKLKGGIPRFTWGKYRVTAYLTNGRQMVVYGGSYAEAKQQLNTMMLLSTAAITNYTQGEDTQTALWRRKEPTIVYPAYAKLIEGDVKPNGELRSKKTESQRIVLWTDRKPVDLPSSF
ncbi:hypothetical protein [Myxosarcina sp. GI1]|uniref:hypothetical protein n=1 Tax=Myxosarcina sp. GI1 TaxID=1541065 RepID=UPI00056CF34C|nr:hypothetical protein [Myxosarcina sp. GI1]